MFNRKYDEEFSIIEKLGIIIVLSSSLLSCIPFGYTLWSLFSNILGEWKFVIFIVTIIYFIISFIGTNKISNIFFKKYNQFNEEIDGDGL